MATEPLHYDLKKLVETDITDVIDASTINTILSKPPFIPIPGIVNLRDIGIDASPYIRPDLIFRSGGLNALSDSSKAQLKDELDIKLILDLRSDREIARSPDPVIEGVKNLHLTSTIVPSPINLEEFIVNGGKDGYVKMYGEILEIHKPSIRAALEWLRDEGTPLLFHCTAGKDRTGVLAAVILGLAGTPNNIIAHNYALTRLAIEPHREALTATLRMWHKDWSYDTPGMKEFSEVKASFMLGALGMVKQKYGGMEGYVKNRLGFSEEEVQKIKKVLKSE
ncbi:hypothetical protein K469DRAFT_666745 [Zopfia rhizophila CBS 207.26]|uniref:Tyrosine specific protein phosphatases domain-containing protein n=1 Tax=Zopfia rhizophila CBS 207.26 TaxID=1314779 RepID=A0A6A6E169_9PEZI|nr:hypothetical protein K469DRAFT_666745 [Zopfia rhizophila CBS 207.26]